MLDNAWLPLMGVGLKGELLTQLCQGAEYMWCKLQWACGAWYAARASWQMGSVAEEQRGRRAFDALLTHCSQTCLRMCLSANVLSCVLSALADSATTPSL